MEIRAWPPQPRYQGPTLPNPNTAAGGRVDLSTTQALGKLSLTCTPTFAPGASFSPGYSPKAFGGQFQTGGGNACGQPLTPAPAGPMQQPTVGIPIEASGRSGGSTQTTRHERVKPSRMKMDMSVLPQDHQLIVEPLTGVAASMICLLYSTSTYPQFQVGVVLQGSGAGAGSYILRGYQVEETFSLRRAQRDGIR